MNAMHRSSHSKFWDWVTRSTDPGACWLWNGQLSSSGYGLAKWGFAHGQKKTTGAHRVAWELENGPVPEGMFVCHKCDNPRCVRPDHLFLGTAADNAQDAKNKGRLDRAKIRERRAQAAEGPRLRPLRPDERAESPWLKSPESYPERKNGPLKVHRDGGLTRGPEGS